MIVPIFQAHAIAGDLHGASAHFAATHPVAKEGDKNGMEIMGCCRNWREDMQKALAITQFVQEVGKFWMIFMDFGMVWNGFRMTFGGFSTGPPL